MSENESKTKPEMDEETREAIETGKRLGITMATVPNSIRVVQNRIDKFINELDSIGHLKSEEQWDMLETFSLRVPKNLAWLLKIYQQGNNRLAALDIQHKKLKFELKLTAQETHGNGRQLGDKDKDIAILNDERYEQAQIQYNIQKNLVEYLDKTIDQYKFLNNSINTRVEIAKLRKDLGF